MPVRRYANTPTGFRLLNDGERVARTPRPLSVSWDAPTSVPMPAVTTVTRFKPNIVGVTDADGVAVRKADGSVKYRRAADLEGKTFERKWSHNPGAGQVGTPSHRLVPVALQPAAALMGRVYEADGGN